MPSWDAATFIIPWDMYQLYGDVQILEDMYDTHKKLVDYSGLYVNETNTYTYQTVNRFLGEYAGVGPVGSVDATAVAYYYHMVNLLAKSATLLGKTDDAATYQALANRVREAYNARYWDAEAMYYRTLDANGAPQPYAQTQNILPLAFGMAPDGSETNIVRRLEADIVARKYHLSAGIYGTRYLMTILSAYGYSDTAFQVATQTEEPSWGWWIANDHSTMFEGWSLNARSYDHHYYGSISSWFFQSLAGIRSREAGYQALVIQPHVPRGLEQVSGSLDTVRGRVVSRWAHAQDGTFELHVSIPTNTPAEVWLPTSNTRALVVPEDAGFIRSEDGYLVYAVDAGTHTFRSELQR